MSTPGPGLPGGERGPSAARPTGVLGGRVRALRAEMAVPLYRNAYALMLNTVVNSGFGLLYWIFAARTFDADEVGRGNALVSLMMLVSVLTQLNFGQALIRFLPRGGTSSAALVRRAYAVSALVAVVGASLVMAYCHFLRDPGDPLYVSAGFGAWFVVSTAAWSLFNLQDAALTGLRSAMWIVLENGVYGVVKLVLLVVVAQTSLSDGVFTSWTLPVIALLVPFNILIFRRVLPRHTAETAPDQHVPDRRTLNRYMAGDYTGQVFNQATSSFLPVLVVTLLGPEQAAFLLPAQTVFIAMNLLQTSITSSLVVEGARDEARAHRFAAAILKRIAVTVLPGSVVLALAAPLLLQLYGTAYRENATWLLVLLMVSMFPRVVVTLYMTMSRLQNRTGPLAVLQFVHAVLMLGGTIALAGPLGLDAVGWSWLAVELLLALVLGPRVLRWLRTDRRAPAAA
ncbi:lipopolysaccharide biosynthesis protein [Pseudonocardia sp. KRD291]|uniref:lipopolysaccharide biosynthesis protein n=1 Tax=Pseudonocardia sp. KRD291 TaxID=2792007 RepID=UPI001C49D279|nr:hypothetical protein [Pseudonocardia sp. KRD291]MBW0104500.1 hypothetical protein [Pseudonocardia sp. KRD291]